MWARKGVCACEGGDGDDVFGVDGGEGDGKGNAIGDYGREGEPRRGGAEEKEVSAQVLELERQAKRKGECCGTAERVSAGGSGIMPGYVFIL